MVKSSVGGMVRDRGPTMDGPVMNNPVQVAFHKGSQIMKKQAMERQSDFFFLHILYF